MSNFSEQLEQIKILILSSSKSEKSFAYSTLQHLQQQSSSNDSLITLLVQNTQSILSPIISDIRDVNSDEEIITLALKCLGFILYHPSLVAAIPMEYAGQALESLARLIKMTKVKVVCNLGVWCVSIQQLEASSLTCHFDSLLMAILHCLDNPAGSLSTTFEAIQAVMKLSTQITEKMRDTSSRWVPPIYRRLLSADKRERDMCIRCLLKIKSLIIPPPMALSKAIAQDLKLRLLPGMKELLIHGKKVQALQAWGWFICILGSYSLKTRHVLNEMLKVPEQTFSDPNSQVQIASQVAWEGLIDALVPIRSEVCGALTTCNPELEKSKEKSTDKTEVNGGTVQTGGYSKRLKLIMTPLIGIITSKTELSVQSSCLNTWCYLLHKLDTSVNDPCLLGTVVEPMFIAVFNSKLDDRNKLAWIFCINLLQDFIQSKRRLNNESYDDAGCKLSARTSEITIPLLGHCSLKSYPVKWLPWDCSQMQFFLRFIQMSFNQVQLATSYLEIREQIFEALWKMFHTFLKEVQVDIAKPATSYDSVMQSINAILALAKMACESTLHEKDSSSNFQVTCLHFLEAVTQELDPSILGSPLYKIIMDISEISNIQHRGEDNLKMLTGTSSMDCMAMVSPVIYLTLSYFSLVIQLSSKLTSSRLILQEAYTYLYKLLLAYDSLEILHAVVHVMYAYVESNSLAVWVTIAKALRGCIADDMMLMKIQPGTIGSLTVCHILLYPVFVHSSEDPMFEQVRDIWVSLYCLVNSIHAQESPTRSNFSEDLCSSLNGFLQRISTDESLSQVFAITKSQSHFLSLCGDIIKCILENVHVGKVTPEAIKNGYTGFSGIKNCLELSARFLKLLSTEDGEASVIASMRLLSSLTHFVGCLQWQEDIICFTKALQDPLLSLLSDVELKHESMKHQVRQLWIEIMKTLQHSWPAIKFDSSFLNIQAPLLETTINHPNSSIADPTISFWNSTYGEQTDLNFPPRLLQVLDKLSRLGKIKIHKIIAPVMPYYDYQSSQSVNAQPQFKVTAKLNTCSKRVEIVDDSCKKRLPPCPKRKRSELTEHQKEVRRAQQGKARDCSGHGPGVRTYTSLDFSQVNEDSQDSQDIRDPELILDLLRRVA